MHAEYEGGALALTCWEAFDGPSIIFYNLLANEQAHTDSFTVYLFLCLVLLQLAKEWEYLLHICIADASTIINHMNYQSLAKGIEAGLDIDPLPERELKRVFSQID